MHDPPNAHIDHLGYKFTLVNQMLAAIVFLFCSVAYAQQASLVVVCAGGSVLGARTEYTKQEGFKIMDDRITLKSLVYAFDIPRKGQVRINYGKDEVVGTVLRSHVTYKTVSYVYKGVPYMDTVFLETRIVLSSEHKDLFGVNGATTWRLKCTVEK